MYYGDVKRLLIWAVQKVDELLVKCDSASLMSENGAKLLQREYYYLVDWMRANQEFHDALAEIYVKLKDIPSDSEPSAFHPVLLKSQTIIKNALGWS